MIRDRLNPLEFYDDLEVKRLFRLERDSILYLLQRLHHRLHYSSQRNSCLTTTQQVCLTLHFYGNGSLQFSLGAIARVDQATVSRTCWRVTQAICDVFRNVISVPDDLTPLKQAFSSKYGFPNVFGCIDCTHIEIKAPPGRYFPDEYINRKGWHSINVQAVCDADCNFIDVEVKWPGSVHDSRIFSNSHLSNRLIQRELNGILLGDRGYSLTPFLLVPYIDLPTNSTVNENFNKKHRIARATIERSFGQIKQRFACLQRCMQINICRVPKTIFACFVLHNICRSRHDLIPSTVEDVNPRNQHDDDDFADVSSNALRRLGEVKRDEIAAYLHAQM